MNIENHMYNAKTCLDTAQTKIEAQDYESALALLADAYSNVRELLQQVFKLQALKVKVARPAGDNSVGPKQ